MTGHTCSKGFVIAILACLLLPAVWAQQPKPGGTLQVAWEADISGLDPHLSFSRPRGWINDRQQGLQTSRQAHRWKKCA